MVGWNHDEANWEKKTCPVCESVFIPRSGNHQFCSGKCKGKWKYISGQETTETQYKLISGDWKRYLSRLIYSAGRKRDQLSRDELLEVLENQDYKCALSGVQMTCNLELGKTFWTNASVDRIKAGGPYTKENIQLVCRGLNSWRSAIPLEEFIWWCQQVVQHHERSEVKSG